MELIALSSVIVFALFMTSVQIDFYNKLVVNKFRFRYFALRDRLAMLVVSGELDEDSWEYREIIDTINFHIQAVESVSIARIATLLISYYTEERGERSKISLSQRRPSSKEVVAIMRDFYATTRRLLYKNSWAQIKTVNLFLMLTRNRHKKLSSRYRSLRLSRIVVGRLERERNQLDKALKAA